MNYSGQPFYPQVFYQLYNAPFTGIPIVCYALLDRALPIDKMKLLESNPSFFQPCRKKELFNLKVFFIWMITGVAQAITVTAIGWCALGDGTVATGRTSADLWTTGNQVFALVVLGANITVL